MASTLGGTTSFKRVKKAREGGKRIPMLKTLGSTSSLWPVAERSVSLESSVALVVTWEATEETRPGTDDLRIKSKSSLSVAMSADLLSVSESLKRRYVGQLSPYERTE